jgi:CheY-like chemotaxis protein
LDATRVIRKSNINTPIIALTASTLDEIRDECYACGMDDYLTKPLVEKDLIEKVIKWSTHSSSQ